MSNLYIGSSCLISAIRILAYFTDWLLFYVRHPYFGLFYGLAAFFYVRHPYFGPFCGRVSGFGAICPPNGRFRGQLDCFLSDISLEVVRSVSDTVSEKGEVSLARVVWPYLSERICDFVSCDDVLLTTRGKSKFSCLCIHMDI